jgi:hypothetical protein
VRIPRELLAQWQSQGEPNSLSDELIDARDYARLQRQDAQIRLWLPDQARIGLEEVCARMGVSMTVYLTEFFATYLFGVHEMLKMRDRGWGLYGAGECPRTDEEDTWQCDPDEEGDPEFDDPVPEMGKNIFALKIFLPCAIKAGLQHRANVAGVPLGRFVRAMICAHLFGRNVGVKALMGPR